MTHDFATLSNRPPAKDCAHTVCKIELVSSAIRNYQRRRPGDDQGSGRVKAAAESALNYATCARWNMSWSRESSRTPSRSRVGQIWRLESFFWRSSAAVLLRSPETLTSLSKGLFSSVRSLVSNLSPDFKDFLNLLVEHEVRFLITGGYAMAAHGHPRYTKDIDIWLDRTPDNAERVMKVIRAFGFGNLDLASDDFTKDDYIIQLGREPNRIDLLTSLSGLGFESSYQKKLEVVVSGIELPFLAREDLIVNKRSVGRPQDRVDADVLDGDRQK